MRAGFFFMGLVLAGPLFGEGEAVYKAIPSVTAIDDPAFPMVELVKPADGQVRSPFDAEVEKAPAPDLFGPGAVALHFQREYEIRGTPASAGFTVVLYGFTGGTPPQGLVKKGDVLGTNPDKGLRIALWSDKVDDYLVLMSTQKPVRLAERYWYNPSFLFSNGSTAYLSFRQKDDFLQTLMGVADEATEGPPGFVLYPDFRVRFKTSLAEYPRALTDDEKDNLAGYETRLYGRSGLLKFATTVKAGKYDYLLCWQGGFDGYLKQEYQLGSDLWIYGAIATYDAWKSVGYIFVRDFSLNSVDAMVDQRLAALRGDSEP